MRTAAICPTCATYTNALCTLYNGSYLSNINVSPLDSLQVALTNINTTFTNVMFTNVIQTVTSSKIFVNGSLKIKSGGDQVINTILVDNSGTADVNRLMPDLKDDDGNSINTTFQYIENLSNDIATDTGSTTKYPSVNAVQGLLPKVYKGYFNQSGTSTPTVTVIKNDLSGAIVWTRNSRGSYTGTLIGAFASTKTFIASKSQTNIEANRELTMFRIDDNNINVYCRKTTDSTLVDLNLTNNSFVINLEIYP